MLTNFNRWRIGIRLGLWSERGQVGGYANTVSNEIVFVSREDMERRKAELREGIKCS
jgi:hypothetical protein